LQTFSHLAASPLEQHEDFGSDCGERKRGRRAAIHT
jgi:hypothetical protein